MKKEKKKVRFPKLSIKILLTLLAVLVMFYVFIFIIFRIALLAGFKLPEDREQVDLWMRYLVYIFPPALGFGIIGVFAFALNKTVVARVFMLRDATNEVAKGNFDVAVEVKGSDELYELADSFNKMSAQLKANEYLSKEFVRNVSHEYKTPISAIRAYGELLDADADDAKIDDALRATLKQYASVIMAQSDRLIALSRSVLQLSLLDSTTIIKKEDSFSPAEQIREILRLMQAKWTEKNITLDLRLEEIKIMSNEQLLYQVWQNLINNAIKFSKIGGIIKIELTAGTTGGIYFEITDEGMGIKDEDKDKIFTQFFMADKSRNSEGSGLGLSIVKKIVEKLDGEISFNSVEGKGSVFRIAVN